MPETPGELIVFIIFTAIAIFIIILVFGFILLFGFSFASSSSCYVSSQIRNFFFNDLCLPSSNQFVHNLFCLSSTLESIGLEPPLIGCSPTVSSYSGVYSESSVFSGISYTIANCFYQYGGYQGLDVLPSSPALCGVISIKTNENFSFYNFTKYLQVESYTSEKSCLNHTAEESCPNYQEGYVCDTSAPSLCERQNYNYFECLDTPGYTPTTEGYELVNIPLNGSGFTAANNATAYLCNESQGCYFNKTFAECMPFKKSNVNYCSQLYYNFCENTSSGKINCTMNYDPTTDSLIPPPSCVQTESVKNTSVVNISFYDYFKPGINVFFSYENKTSGKPGIVVSPFNKTLDLQNSTIYIVYLNSFANTRFPPQEIQLPPECAPVSWYNNYPSNCWDYCVRAVATYGSLLGAAGSYNPGIISVSSEIAAGAAAGVGYHYCTQNNICSNYVLPSAYQEISTLAWTTSGLGNCFSCIESIPQFFGGNVLGRNIVFVCAQVS